MDQGSANVGTSPTTELNFFQRLIGVFLTPGNTFESINRKPDWIFPMVVVILITLLFTMVTTPITIPEQMEKQRETMLEKRMSEDQIDSALATGEKIGKIMAPIGALVVTPIMILIFTLIMWFVGNIVLGGQTSFIKMFSVYTYTSIIGMLGLLLKIPLIMSKHTADIHFSLALLLPDAQSKSLLYSILKTLEVFSIWHFAVLAIGFSVIYKFSMKKAGWTMAIVFIIFSAISVIFSQVFGS